MTLIKELSSQQLHGAILTGCHYLINQKETLNQINVFPVADGDTGDNLAATASAILSFSSVKPSIHETLQTIADASVIGARGNSGNIFSEFFNALTLKQYAKAQLDSLEFSELLKTAATEVRNSLLMPIEGTMLTLIEAWAKVLEKSLEQSPFINVLMENLLPALEQTVENTKGMLDVLNKANVVDAGALGFYYFVHGFSAFLSNPEIKIDTTLLKDVHHNDHPVLDFDELPTHRYCTEAVLQAHALDKEKLLATIKPHGDSIVLTGNERLVRFHVHTDEPWHVFPKLLAFGMLQYPKIDDMLRQYQVIHTRKYPIALVTDSSADLPEEWLERYQIHQIQVNMQLGEHQLLGRYCIALEEFYEALADYKDYPKTSCPSVAAAEEKLAFLSRHYDHVLVLSISKAVSGTYDAIAKAAKNHPKVKVLDTKTNTAAQGLLLEYAGQMIEAGYSWELILQNLEKAVPLTSIYVYIDQFDSLIRSGRVSKLAGWLGHYSGIKPIISIDKEGKGIIYSKVLGKKNSHKKLIQIVNDQMKKSGLTLSQYAIIHAGVSEEAEEFSKLTTQAFNQAPAFIEPVSPAIGLHAGKGCIAIAVRFNPN